jgi:hypothetical protein
MFPCIGRMVVPLKDDPAQEESRFCRVCGGTLADSNHHGVQDLALCRVCYDRFMSFEPNLAH